jgi:SET domain-containing protein
VSVKHLLIQDSSIQGAGKGLFAKHPTQEQDAIVFHKGDKIIAYDGELTNRTTLTDRYGPYTAPYGIEISRDRMEDGALHRGIATLTNHRPMAQCNARFSVSRGRIVLVATKRIRNHQEIFVNYGKSYRFNEPTTYVTRR